jgi:hypothetical protein
VGWALLRLILWGGGMVFTKGLTWDGKVINEWMGWI